MGKLTGVGVGNGVGKIIGVGVGNGVGKIIRVAVGWGVGVGNGVGMSTGVGVGTSVAVGWGVGAGWGVGTGWGVTVGSASTVARAAATFASTVAWMLSSLGPQAAPRTPSSRMPTNPQNSFIRLPPRSSKDNMGVVYAPGRKAPVGPVTSGPFPYL